ncbi:uncharacterized protein LOC105693654 [Athalia rosae]|uniref:uncharacterized protein LOC105693654 n=1 Tax=Athalia rosae TaxID=37344 RepID=UPI0020347F37|nr:uncharacterized protein LOC105693654 [Athalia rosae]XP_025602143.2 uncharacterized protein LOC105693654 [Athalia rosae]
MAESCSYVSLGELLEESAETEDQDVILDRLKLLAYDNLPEGWTNWKTINYSKEDLFGEGDVDPQILNKLRFALPTIGIAIAFNPSATYLAERQYRDYKVEMLNWALCRALIMSPPSITNKLKGSIGQAELFQQAIKPVKHLCVSRRSAAEELKLEAEGSNMEEAEEESLPPRKRHSASPGSIGSLPKRSRVAFLENRMDEMFSILCEKIEKLKKPEVHPLSYESDVSMSEKENLGSEDSESIASGIESQGSAAWKAPSFEHSQGGDLDALALTPQVKESEPSIPVPTPEIKAQGLSCQKLGTPNWNKIRYKEVQKNLQASPVFDALKVNSQLGGLTQKSFSQSILVKMDAMAGTITHGLLKERAKITDGLRALAQKYPDAYTDIKDIFLGESSVKQISDDLLQYSCARRAEIIEMRRRFFKPKDLHLVAKLEEIPPSESHLFAEEMLSNFVNQQGGIYKIFHTNQRSFKSKNFSDYKAKPNRSSRAGGFSQAGHRSHSSHNTSSFRKSGSKEYKKDSKKDSSRKEHRPKRF